MGDVAAIPFASTEQLRQEGMERAALERQSEIMRATQEARQRGIGMTPKPAFYSPNRWQKVRDMLCPCIAPPKVVEITTARPAQPPKPFFRQFNLNGMAPEPPSKPRK